MWTKFKMTNGQVAKQAYITGDDWDGPRWLKWFQTININLTCIALGLIVSLMGPTLIDLSEIFHTSIQTASNIGMVADIGAIVGPFFASVLFGRLNAQMVCIVCGIFVGLANIALPLGSLASAYGFSFLSGMLGAILEIGVYVWLVGLWNGSRPILQLYSLMFGVGALISPLIAKPFLSRDRTLAVAETELTGDADAPASGSESRVVVPFALIGGFGILVALLMTVSLARDRRDIRPAKKAEAVGFRLREWLLTALVASYHFLIVLSETAFNRFLVIYAIQVNHMLKADATVLVSLFWVGFTAVRVLIIPISAKVRSAWLVGVGQIVFNVACAVLLLASHDTRMLYVGTVLFGCGLAPLYGGSLTWLTEHLSMRHAYLSLILVLTCAGAMVAPPLVGPWIEDHPRVLVITVSAGSVGMLVMFGVMMLCAHLLPIAGPGMMVSAASSFGDGEAGSTRDVNVFDTTKHAESGVGVKSLSHVPQRTDHELKGVDNLALQLH